MPRRPALVAYISGHGFGHFTRSAVVLEPLCECDEVELHLRTAGQALLLGRETPGLASVEEMDVGPGVTQRGPIEVDIPATRQALERHLAAWPRLIEREVAFVRSVGARAVYADSPPIAYAIARRAGVPSVGLGNFPWSWIYDGYAHHDAAFHGLAAKLAEAEALTTQFLALEMGGGLEVFPNRLPIAPVVRRAAHSREWVRSHLPFALDGRPLVLVTFGGYGRDIDLGRAVVENPGLELVFVGPKSESGRTVLPSPALTHPDLVAAADCIIGKPGYGTVTECFERATPFVHVSRGEFRESPALVDAIERYLPCATLSHDELHSGRWTEAVSRAMARRPVARAPVPNGSAAAVGALRAVLQLDHK